MFGGLRNPQPSARLLMCLCVLLGVCTANAKIPYSAQGSVSLVILTKDILIIIFLPNNSL